MEKTKKSLFGPMDLTRGTCWKTILIFSLPVILSYLLQQVYSISDAAIVGQTLTAQEVAGVNDTSSLVFIFLQFAFGVSAGFCVVTSCQVGARNQAGVRRSLATQIVLSAVLTVLLTALALALLNPMLAWINVTPDNAEVYRAAYTYCFIIFAGIVARFPQGCMTIYKYIQAGSINIFQALLFAVIALFMIVVVIEVTQGQRRVTVQYAKRIVGRKMYGGHSTHIPLKVNQAGVIPIIFASSVLMFPITIAQFVQNETVQWIASFFAWGTVTNTVMYALLIMFFTYFYTAISLNIPQLTENMQKYGGFIPGIRPGQPTAMYIDRIMTRITLAGAFFLAFIAILPNFIGWITGIEGVYFGGTAILIVVGVAIDTMKQAESLVLNRQYQGFMK